MSKILCLSDLDVARKYYEAGFWLRNTFYTRLQALANTSPSAYALQDAVGRYSYSELLAWTDELATRLYAAGLREGDRVVVWASSRAESVVTLLACSRMGFVCVPSLHRDSTCAEVLGLLERCNARAIILEQGWGADVQKVNTLSIFKELEQLLEIIELSPMAHATPWTGQTTEWATANSPWTENPDKVIYIAFTSGTTGQPKGVMHSDNTILANGRELANDWGLFADTIVYCMSPMSHNMGTVGLAMTLACGGEFVAHGSEDRHRTFERIIETDANFLIGVPTHAIDLLSKMHENGAQKLGSVRTFQLSGAAVPTGLVEELVSLGIAPQNMFGMTENCAALYTRPGDPADLVIRSCGRPPVGLEVELWSDDPNIEVDDGQIGEIGVRGTSMMLGYFNDQAVTEGSYNSSGWFLTGDLARHIGDGNFEIVGRKKDLIIRGGHNVHPLRIEDFALRHELIEQAAVFPVPDPRLGEKIGIAIVSRPAGAVGPEELLSYLNSVGLSRYDTPEYFVELESLPLTASGKVLKRELVGLISRGEVSLREIRWRSSLD